MLYCSAKQKGSICLLYKYFTSKQILPIGLQSKYTFAVFSMVPYVAGDIINRDNVYRSPLVSFVWRYHYPWYSCHYVWNLSVSLSGQTPRDPISRVKECVVMLMVFFILWRTLNHLKRVWLSHYFGFHYVENTCADSDVRRHSLHPPVLSIVWRPHSL